MSIDRVAVLGGGPGGLYAARLLKLAAPRLEVTVYEQGVPDKTFGFGVGLAGRTQRNLDAADPDTLRDIVAAAHGHHMELRVGGASAWIHNDNLIAIARTELLAVLQRHADKAGVVLRFGERVTPADVDADLVIAADGVSSAARQALSDELAASIEQGSGLYLWCGADFALDNALFSPVETEHGTFVTHAYPYADDLSTFLIETDEHTWQRAGLDQTTASTPPDQSDTASLAYLERIFAEQLQGHRLIGNRTRWQRFRTVRCGKWHHGNTVLLGDAAHTAHYSIGSGTKLAMEDAIALCQAIVEEPDLAAALERYERVRQPEVGRLQEVARRSQLWWESFPARMTMPVEQLMVAYMTRAGKVSLDRFVHSSPDVARAGLAYYGGTESRSVPEADVSSWVLEQPLHRNGVSFTRRVLDDDSARKLNVVEFQKADVELLQGDLCLAEVADQLLNPWSRFADIVVQRAVELRSNGIAGFWLSGPRDREAVLTRMELAERLRLETGGLVVVQAPQGLVPDLAAGLASGRMDLIAFDEEHAA
ncbi:FAD-dependent monooxygenase [Saccharopolyspora phatthalungensis]|uniref:2-polyprenyl-6-methoxyphenol hydroxylase-like FAD-dependent oxidoreductase n=1 Tax=Saccharopolyspora phatthalungensis TaxID=664693 RepID=A0A840Q009_9PSEU|nr:FAD-dependent monooxygenase [Saccharopolyspora phatthalungensis]MBB5153644.1 2-polyprenyl-6-methoxyphenol hydroxylase-like FAD-dependent oxidoreductase [Saccharopolyspora phatthalungensis]